MTFRPRQDRVVAKRIEADDKSAGGITIPDIAQKKSQHGGVIGVGRSESPK